MKMNDFTTWLIGSGVSKEMLLLVIFIPVIATLTNVSRYVVGLKTLGTYPAMILAFAYYLTGARYGIAITIIIVLTSLFTHSILKRVRMHYMSRISINYIVLAIVLLGFFVIMNKIPFLHDNLEIENISPLSIVLIATLSDFVTKQFVKNNIFVTMRGLVETMIIALIGWTVMRYDTVSTFLLNNLWIVPVLIIVNFLVGQTTSLRAMDFLRFKQIIRDEDQSDTK